MHKHQDSTYPSYLSVCHFQGGTICGDIEESSRSLTSISGYLQIFATKTPYLQVFATKIALLNYMTKTQCLALILSVQDKINQLIANLFYWYAICFIDSSEYGTLVVFIFMHCRVLMLGSTIPNHMFTSRVLSGGTHYTMITRTTSMSILYCYWSIVYLQMSTLLHM